MPLCSVDTTRLGRETWSEDWSEDWSPWAEEPEQPEQPEQPVGGTTPPACPAEADPNVQTWLVGLSEPVAGGEGISDIDLATIPIVCDPGTILRTPESCHTEGPDGWRHMLFHAFGTLRFVAPGSTHLVVLNLATRMLTVRDRTGTSSPASVVTRWQLLEWLDLVALRRSQSAGVCQRLIDEGAAMRRLRPDPR